jgi:hypothetical protein
VRILSALALRPGDPAVKRAAALVETRLGGPEAVQLWAGIPEDANFTSEELDARAEAMALHGDDRQFTGAVAALERAGLADRAVELKSLRNLRKGDFGRAVGVIREAAAERELSPSLRLALLRLLAARHRPFLIRSSPPGGGDLLASREMEALIDGLAGTPVADEALAVGLPFPAFPSPERARWAAAARRNPSASNPALLPAADFLVQSGAESPAVLQEELAPVFRSAPLPLQADFAAWMLGAGLREEALATATAAAAAQDERLFSVRAAALAALSSWEELHKLGDAPTRAPESVRLMAKAQAAGGLDRRGEQADLIRRALRSGAVEGNLARAAALADAQDQRSAADEMVARMCSDPALAEPAFHLARDRFARRGQFATLAKAAAKASAVAPGAPSVADYRRYESLLDGRPVDPRETAAAIAAEPGSTERRITHALALLKADHPKEALAVFDGFDVQVEGLPPGYQAVAFAIMAANGQSEVAARLARDLDPGLLTPGEYALIREWRVAP